MKGLKKEMKNKQFIFTLNMKIIFFNEKAV